MPVIKCPECGEVVLDRLSKCPHCGKQIPMSARYPQFYDNNSAENTYDSGLHNEQSSYKNENFQSTKNVPAYGENSTAIVKINNAQYKATCPKCGGTNISYQREQTASFGAGTNKVVIQQPKKSKGCLYWIAIGWWWKPIYWLLIGWWWRPLFGGRTKSGLNFNANKTINRTMAICQNCGHSWKV